MLISTCRQSSGRLITTIPKNWRLARREIIKAEARMKLIKTTANEIMYHRIAYVLIAYVLPDVTGRWKLSLMRQRTFDFTISLQCITQSQYTLYVAINKTAYTHLLTL